IIRMDFSKMNASTEGEGSLNIGSAQNDSGTRIDSKESAQMAISQLDEALNRVADYRATIGSFQNRFQSTDTNLGVSIENLSAAKSRIKDADFAQETAAFTSANILQQAGASILTQANQMPSVALKLL